MKSMRGGGGKFVPRLPRTAGSGRMPEVGRKRGKGAKGQRIQVLPVYVMLSTTCRRTSR